MSTTEGNGTPGSNRCGLGYRLEQSHCALPSLMVRGQNDVPQHNKGEWRSLLQLSWGARGVWPQSNESPNCCPRPVQCPSGMEACPPGQLINMADGVWHCQRIRKDLCALYGHPSQRPYNTTPTRSPLIPTTSLPPLSHALHGYPTKGKPLTQGPHRSRLRRPSTSQRSQGPSGEVPETRHTLVPLPVT